MKPLRSSLIGGLVFLVAAAAWGGFSWLAYTRTIRHSWLDPAKDITFIILTAGILIWLIYANARRIEQLEEDVRKREKTQQRRQSNVQTLIQAANCLNSESPLGSTLEYVCRSACVAVGGEAGTLTLYRPEGGVIEPAATYGLTKAFIQHFRPIAHSGSCLHVVEQTWPFTFSADADGLSAIPYGALYREAGYKTVLYQPLHDGTNFLGELTILFSSQDPQRFTPYDLSLLKAFADNASMAIRNERLRSKSQENSRRLETLRATDLAILSSLDLGLTLRLVLRELIEQLKADAADVLLLDPASQSLEYAAGLGFLTKDLEASRVQLGTGFAGKVALERRSMYVADVNAAEPFTRRELILNEGVVTYFGAPLAAKGEIKGVLEIFQRRPFYPEDSWLAFVETLAGQAAIAIDNASLFTKLQQTNLNLTLAYDRTLEGWSRALDLRDKATEGRTERVTSLCVSLAKEMNVPDSDLVQIRRGALLHDIGKMTIPDSVLLKPEPYDEEAAQAMRKHPTLAYELLSPISFLQPALEIPYSHHERWDGSGYPRGLKGEVIPLSARIFAVADAWEESIGGRSYHKPMSRAQAAQYLREQAGRQFDPQVVTAFLRMIEGNGAVRERKQLATEQL